MFLIAAYSCRVYEISLCLCIHCQWAKCAQRLKTIIICLVNALCVSSLSLLLRFGFFFVIVCCLFRLEIVAA